MARWTASAKWAAGRALDGQCDMPLALRLSEGLGPTRTPVVCAFAKSKYGYSVPFFGQAEQDFS